MLSLIAGMSAVDDPWGERSGTGVWTALAFISFIVALVAFAIGTVRLVANFDISNYYNAIHLGRMENPQTAAQQLPPTAPPSPPPPPAP